jgi:toxin ParE1/3/4
MAHRLAPEAETDLDDVWLHIASNSSVETADRFVDSLTDRFFLLSAHPFAGRRRDDLWPEIRLFPAGDYVVLYFVEGSDVRITRVVDGRRDLEALFE